jgi:hypothetical protein
MTDQINTLELARIYESQGHYQDALSMYTDLKKNGPTAEISAGMKRMKTMRVNPDSTGLEPANKIEGKSLHELISSIESEPSSGLENDLEIPPVKKARLGSLLEKLIHLWTIEHQTNQINTLRSRF